MRNIFIIATMLIFSFAACNKGQEEADSAGTDEMATPPSLRQGGESVKLLHLSDKEQSELNVQTVTIQKDRIEYPVSAPGVVFNHPEHASIISVPVDGQISAINRREGEWVSKGQELFRIQSLVYGSMVSDYLIAYAEEQYQTGRLRRIRQLVAETITSESELAQAESEHNRAVVNLRASYSKLKAIGVSDSEIESFTTSDNINPVLKIHSPLSGMVDRNFVEPGQSVNALENLSRIVDSRMVLIRGYLNPDDVRLIQTGDSVTVSRRENRSFLLRSTIASVNPGLDEESMSVVVNIYAVTNGKWPKPGENVHLSILSSLQDEIIVIPFESLTYDGNDPVVFVKKDKGVFEKRQIKLLDIGENNVFVREGLMVGEEVAVTQVFSLKALSRYDMISEE